MNNETTFKVGDVVQLRSGGPPMTVTDVAEAGDAVSVVWFGNGRVDTVEGVPVAALMRVDDIAQASAVWGW